MRIDYDLWHPLPRYGLAVLLYHHPSTTIEEEDRLVATAVDYIEKSLTRFMIAPAGLPDEINEKVDYGYHADARPGKANGQISANGFFSAPHIVTGNNAADIVKEAQARIAEGRKPKRPASVELKKSFAPTVSKINAGATSMSNPRVPFVEALFTAIGALTSLKPAAYDYDLSSNVALVPDLPMAQMHNYVRIIEKLLLNAGDQLKVGSYKAKKYGRPLMFKGNFADAPRFADIGALGLLAAIGRYTKRATDLDAEEARPVLEALANRPIYLFANGGSSQQSYSHHLVSLALTGELHAAVEAINQVEILSIEGHKYKDPKWNRFKIATSLFLRLFSKPYATDFFAFRASYPAAFEPIFKTYFMQRQQLDRALVESAEAFGKTLNYAAYRAAQQEVSEDAKGKALGRDVQEYKNRIITQFESTIGSAKSGSELVSRISTIVGRSSGLDFGDDAAEYIRQACEGEIDLDTLKHLATAFMRLRSPKQTANLSEGDAAPDSTQDDSLDESDTSAMPNPE